MAVLAVEIGNAHTQLGLVSESVVTADWRVSTDPAKTGDELAVMLAGLLGPKVGEISGIAIAATVPAALSRWRQMLERHFPGIKPVIVGSGVRTGLPVQVDNPREVGSDRICRAVAAAHKFDGPCIVVSYGGTATTFDVINAAGAYIGGAISPGIELMRSGLAEANAQLRDVEILKPRSVIGKNTVEALQSGILFGMAAQSRGLVDQMISELGCDRAEVNVIATGYMAPVVQEAMSPPSVFSVCDPWLSLEGLELIYYRNS